MLEFPSLVKMFARDIFPYYNASLTEADLNLSKLRLSKFLVVGINEAYNASVQLLLRLLGVQLRDDQIHLPASMTSTYQKEHEELKVRARSEAQLSARILAANKIDVQLYEWGVGLFCKKLCASNLLSYDSHNLCSGRC